MNTPGTNRRRFLGTSALALLGAGCCSTADNISGLSGAPLASTLDDGSSLLGVPVPEIRNRVTSHLLDAHCHLFNATDVQVGGYLEGPIADDVGDALLRSILQGLAGIADWFGRNYAPSAAAEYRELTQMRATSGMAWESQRQQILQTIDAREQASADMVMRKIEGKRSLKRQVDTYLGNYNEALSPEFIYQCFQPLPMTARAVRENPTGDGLTLQGALAFIGFMLSHRYENLCRYQQAYSLERQAIGVNGCYASMVDFDRWIGRCDTTFSSARDQMLLLAEIAAQSDDYVRPLISYNPWSDVAGAGESLALVRDAVLRYGFVGVKIYPQMGYGPHGNAADPSYPGSGRRPNLADMDKRLRVLFEFCREQRIPVMTHSGNSRGQTRAHNRLGGPASWARFFDAAENSGAKINLGHIGGEVDRDGQGDWTNGFVDIMTGNPAAANLYGDLGFWDGLARGDARAVARLRGILDRDLPGGGKVVDRVMFGSDWFMLTTTADWSTYATGIHQTLARELPAAWMEKIFHENATRLFSRT